MKYYCPIEKSNKALELARDETWSFWQDIVDEDYEPDGITITTTIKKVGSHYIIEIK